MLIVLQEKDVCINPDYIINLYKKHEPPKVIGAADKYNVIARMIDGSLVLLATFTTDSEGSQ